MTVFVSFFFTLPWLLLLLLLLPFTPQHHRQPNTRPKRNLTVFAGTWKLLRVDMDAMWGAGGGAQRCSGRWQLSEMAFCSHIRCIMQQTCILCEERGGRLKNAWESFRGRGEFSKHSLALRPAVFGAVLLTCSGDFISTLAAGELISRDDAMQHIKVNFILQSWKLLKRLFSFCRNEALCNFSFCHPPLHTHTHPHTPQEEQTCWQSFKWRNGKQVSRVLLVSDANGISRFWQ